MIISFLEGLRKPPFECDPSAETLVMKPYRSMGIGLSCPSKLAESLTGRLGYGIGYGKFQLKRHVRINADKSWQRIGWDNF